MSDLEDDYVIRNLAYELWEKAGRPPGKHLDFWEQASRKIGRATTAGSPKENAGRSRADAVPMSDHGDGKNR